MGRMVRKPLLQTVHIYVLRLNADKTIICSLHSYATRACVLALEQQPLRVSNSVGCLNATLFSNFELGKNRNPLFMPKHATLLSFSGLE